MIGYCRDCGDPTELLVYVGPERRSGLGTIRVDFLCAGCGKTRREEILSECNVNGALCAEGAAPLPLLSQVED